MNLNNIDRVVSENIYWCCHLCASFTLVASFQSSVPAAVQRRDVALPFMHTDDIKSGGKTNIIIE